MEKRFNELCYACRIGDTDNVDRLASTGVNLNSVDEFDNSPLFLASLCGHEEVVKLLLKRGAVCDRDRYEGARCVYGALTDSIRDILLKYDISKAVDVNQPFVMHISSLLKNQLPATHDICLGTTVGNEERLNLHRFILSARSPSLKENFYSVWKEKHEIDITQNVSISVTETLAKFIYLVPVLHEIDPKDFDCLTSMAREWQMSELEDFLHRVRHVVDPSDKSTMMAEYQFKFTEDARLQFKSLVDDEILKNIQDVDAETSLEASSVVERFATCSAFPDLIVVVEDSDNYKRLFPCHLAILSRCIYFKLMFTLPFSEQATYNLTRKGQSAHSRVIPSVSFPSCEFEVAEIILRYLYYDSSDIPWKFAIDVLMTADLLLEDRLKSMAAVVITQSKEILENYSIFDILYVAWETRMERLEHYAAKVVALDMKYYAKHPELKQAITLSSRRISAREETDSIEFVDDIRYYLLEKYSFEPDDIDFLSKEDDTDLLEASGITEYKEDVAVIENVLDELALQA